MNQTANKVLRKIWETSEYSHLTYQDFKKDINEFCNIRENKAVKKILKLLKKIEEVIKKAESQVKSLNEDRLFVCLDCMKIFNETPRNCWEKHITLDFYDYEQNDYDGALKLIEYLKQVIKKLEDNE